MLRTILVLAAVVACVNAGTMPKLELAYPASHAMCAKTKYFKTIDHSSRYGANINDISKSMCVRSFMDLCAGPQGVIPCDKTYATCKKVQYDWENAALYPASKRNMLQTPEECVSRGAFWHPETAVLAVAQPVIAFSVYVAALTMTLIVTRAHISILTMILAIFTTFICILLMFSFYYLNALIGMFAMIGALTCYATKSRAATGLGMFLLLTALFWFTYEGGLGAIQHHSRLTATSGDDYQTKCDNYYRGYFSYPQETHGTWDNPRQTTDGYCLRGWVAAEYFFITFLKLLLLGLVGCGSLALSECPKE